MTKRLQTFDTDAGQLCARMGCIDNHDRDLRARQRRLTQARNFSARKPGPLERLRAFGFLDVRRRGNENET